VAHWSADDWSSDYQSVTDYGARSGNGRPQYEKSPSEAIRATFNWAARLNGETISAIEYELPDGLSNEAETGSGSVREIRISGGDVGTIYRVVCNITTSGTRDLQWVKRVRVREG